MTPAGVALELAPGGVVTLGDAGLTARDVALVARHGHRVRLGDAARRRIAASHAALGRELRAGAAIYGVTTGLGAAADTPVVPDDAETQRRVIAARAVGVGRFAAPDETRAVMTARLAGFAAGCSGVSPGAAEALLALLNARVHPAMPLIGSVGEGDLAPLAHVAEVVAGGGFVLAGDGPEIAPAAGALARAGLAPPRLGAKDGLALVSSNAASVGIGALAVADAGQALAALTTAATLSLEAFRGNVAPLLPAATVLRPAPGQAEAASAVLALLAGGDLARPGAARLLQDPLSFRCVAPVHGAGLAALAAATAAVELELNAAADNPAIVPGLDAHGSVVPTANFDPTHLTLAFETLGQALARVAALSAGRVMKLMSTPASGLPRFLTPVGSGRTGFAAVQKTVAALCAEIGQRAAPLPAWLPPTADGVEDYATVALSVVEKTRESLSRLRLLAAAELMVAAQACEMRGVLRLGDGAARVMAAVRAAVPPLGEDRSAAPDLRALDALIGQGAFDDALPSVAL